MAALLLQQPLGLVGLLEPRQRPSQWSVEAALVANSWPVGTALGAGAAVAGTGTTTAPFGSAMSGSNPFAAADQERNDAAAGTPGSDDDAGEADVDYAVGGAADDDVEPGEEIEAEVAGEGTARAAKRRAETSDEAPAAKRPNSADE